MKILRKLRKEVALTIFNFSERSNRPCLAYSPDQVVAHEYPYALATWFIQDLKTLIPLLNINNFELVLLGNWMCNNCFKKLKVHVYDLLSML